MRGLLRDSLPPFILNYVRRLRGTLRVVRSSQNPQKQDLDVYWDAGFVAALDTWGEGNVWDEIQYLMVGLRGRILDIACGTGRTMEILQAKYPELEIFGCDISDLLIRRAVQRGILDKRLAVCDATRTAFKDGEFASAYSIGSLEHFTIPGIPNMIGECKRITRSTSFHMVPVSRSGCDEGWTKTIQSFHNNSEEWWRAQFAKHYHKVLVLDSRWNDRISIGKWFVCDPDGGSNDP